MDRWAALPCGTTTGRYESEGCRAAAEQEVPLLIGVGRVRGHPLSDAVFISHDITEPCTIGGVFTDGTTEAAPPSVNCVM